MRRPLTAALIVAAVWPASAQMPLDGDTIRLGALTVRLHGIDSPELAQACDGGAWHPGPLARQALAAFIAGRAVECVPLGRDRYGRTIARCTAGGEDLGRLMVGAGWAWAYRRYSGEYVGLEEEARGARRGVHAHQCELPEDHRRRRR